MNNKPDIHDVILEISQNIALLQDAQVRILESQHEMVKVIEKCGTGIVAVYETQSEIMRILQATTQILITAVENASEGDEHGK